MSVAAFRRICLSMPEAVESQHMGHPDFRVRGRIFATLMPFKPGSRERFGMAKLTPAQQKAMVAANPRSLSPVPGAWGARGMTRILLAPASARDVASQSLMRKAVKAAWRNTAPTKLADQSIFAVDC